MTHPLGDPRVASIPIHEKYEPLVTLGASFGPARARVRSGVAALLRRAQVELPVGARLSVLAGHGRTDSHATGAAVDVTLVDLRGVELDMGDHRQVLLEVLRGVGLVDSPAEWWHWSHGDRYWALRVGAPFAVYGPVTDLDASGGSPRGPWWRDAA